MAKTFLLLQGGPDTAFEYRIAGGMTERDADEWEAMDSKYVLGSAWPVTISGSVDLHHRMEYMRRRGLGFSFIGVKDPELKNSMESVCSDLPGIIAIVLADFYRNGTAKLTDLLENIGTERAFGPVSRWLSALAENKKIAYDPEKLLDNSYITPISADRFGCTSLFRVGREYRSFLILQIEYR